MQRLNTLLTKVAPVNKLLMQPLARSFNRSVKPPVQNYGAYMMMGAGMTGMAYLTWKSMNLK
jgi:hypothetical protein